VSYRQALGVAVLRITLGVIYVMHGYLGASVLGPAAMAQYVRRAGLPETFAEPFAWYVIVAHLVGGLMLIVGFWTAVAALAQLPIMAGAVFLHHLPQGFFMRALVVDKATGPVAGGYEFALLALAATVALVFTGGGSLSIDGRRRYRSPFSK